MIYKNYIFMTTDKDRPKKRRVEISVPDVRNRKNDKKGKLSETKSGMSR